MNFAELQDAVLSDTKAVQHTDLIARKINAAVLYISRSGKYFHDVMEVILDAAAGVDPNAYIQAVPIPSGIRAVAYLQNAVCPDSKFRGYTVDDMGSAPGALDVFYLAGTTVHIRHRVLTSEFALGYYTSPVKMVEDSDSNWITEAAEELIVDFAAAMVLVQLGEKETSKAITAFSQQNLALTMRDTIDTGGATV